MRYKFVADWKGVVVDYNPTYRARKETGIAYMRRKVKETQRFANGMFNKSVVLYVYEKQDDVYKEIETIKIPALEEEV